MNSPLIDKIPTPYFSTLFTPIQTFYLQHFYSAAEFPQFDGQHHSTHFL